MSSKIAIKMAQDLLDRFFREAEGKMNRQIDVYYTLQDMGVPRERAEEGLEYLTSRGLLNMFGPDIAFLTDLGVAAVQEERSIADLQKVTREFAPTKGQSQAPTARPSRAPEPAAPSASSPPPAATPLLDYLDPDGAEHTFELGSSCSIGRAEGNTIQLADQRASKRHAEIAWDGKGFVLKDLGAANGTLVNGEYVVEHALKHGDEIVIGRTALIFRTPPGGGRPKDLARAEPQRPEPRPEPQRPEPRPEPQRPEPRPEPQRPEPRAEAPRPPREMAAQSSPSVTGIKVVKGRPDARPTPRAATPLPDPGDLFEERREPTIPPFSRQGPAVEDPRDLFAQPARAGRGESDLFGGRAPRGEPDLFAEPAREARDAARAAHDLFAEEPLPRGVEPSSEDLFAEDDGNAATSVRDRIDLEELPMEDLEELPPIAAPSGGARPTQDTLETDDLAALAASPTHGLPVVEPSNLEDPELEMPRTVLSAGGPATDEALARPWVDEPTPADVVPAEPGDLLANVAVARDLQPEGDANTVMLTREQLFGDAPDALGQATTDAGQDGADAPTTSGEEGLEPEELPRWGEEEAPLGSHPLYGGPDPEAKTPSLAVRAVSGEDLPEADPALADLSLSNLASPAVVDSPFHRTLRQLRQHAERAALPDRAEILAAIELLETHPYVRVALNLSETDG